MTKRIFIDTSAWVAYLLKGEKHHNLIAAYLNRLFKGKTKVFTSDYVLDESWTRLIVNQGFYHADVLHTKIKQAQSEDLLIVFHTIESFFEDTWNYFAKYSDHKLSFTDANIIFYVKTFNIDEVVTLDGGLKKAGLNIYPDLGHP